MGEHQRFAGLEVWRDGFVVKFLLSGVRHEDHDDIGPCGSLGRRLYGEAVFFGFGARRACVRQAHAYVAAAVTQIQRVSMSLRAIAENRDLFRLDE